jgi:hypothetical protein
VVEPWDVAVKESRHVFAGDYRGEIRIWGRRRLLALESLLPHAEKVEARLLGTGMPSYWTVFQKRHRFDLGLSGWTQNDWSRAARFDLLASTAAVSEGDVTQAAEALEKHLRLSPGELAAKTDLSREAATSALQRLCREGRAMFDLADGVYRWRQLLPFAAEISDDGDARLALARRLVATGGVRFLKAGEEDEEGRRRLLRGSRGGRGDDPLPGAGAGRGNQARAQVPRGPRPGRRRPRPVRPVQLRLAPPRKAPERSVRPHPGGERARLAADGRRRRRRRGAVRFPRRRRRARPAAGPVQGQTFVFTGALTLFTREQAEALVVQGGGKASGSVSRRRPLSSPAKRPAPSSPRRGS